MQIIPAILVNAPQELNQQLTKLSPYFSHLQIDIADGIYVPEKTITLQEISESRIENKELRFDFDLLVDNIEESINSLDKLAKRLSIDTVFIHKQNSSFIIHNPLFSTGMGIDPQISVETIIQQFDINSLPAIQIMSVEPGAQGRTFIKEALNKIEQLRKAGYRNKIYLDGGINEKTIPLILENQFRPDFLCIGSYLSETQNIEERIYIINSILKSSGKEGRNNV